MLAAEFGCPREQFVLDGDRRSPAELGVERAQQRVLAAGGGGEIGRAVDDAVVGDEHAATVCEPADTETLPRLLEFQDASGIGQQSRGRSSAGVLPISSTPLPFHRNFTTLSRPSMPPE